MEIWKAIDSESWYEVSTTGRVRGWKSKGFGAGRRLSEPRYFTGALTREGHIRVAINSRLIPVHHLVLEAFVGPCPEGMEGCHNNGVPSDNRLENLRWDTKAGNQADRVLHGTDMRGEKSPNHKLTSAQVEDIRDRYGSILLSRKQRRELGLPSQRDLALEYGISQPQIGRILRKESRCYL